MKDKKRKITLALALIVKDEIENLPVLLDNVQPYCDEIQVLDNGSLDGTIEWLEARAKKSKVPFHVLKITPASHPEYFVEVEGRTRPKFAKLRNLSFEGLKSDYILWLDADDKLDHPELLHELLGEVHPHNVDCIDMTYNYHVSSEGSVLMSHPKERIVRNGRWQWERLPDYWLVHENLYLKEQREVIRVFTDKIAVWHRKTDLGRSSQRNIDLLTYMAQSPELKNDAKVWYLLARELYGNGQYMESEAFYDRALKMPLNDGDRLYAYFHLACIAEMSDDYELAKKRSFNMIEARPDHPMGYVYVAKYLLLLGEASEALNMCKIALNKRTNPLDSISNIDASLNFIITSVISEAYDRLGNYKAAIDVMQQYLQTNTKPDIAEMFNKEIETTQQKQTVEDVAAAYELMAKIEFERQLSEQKKVNKQFKLDQAPYRLLETFLPDILKRHKKVLGVRRSVGMSSQHEKGHITIWCSHNFEQWDPDTIISKGGGGSETAVVEMSKRFVQAGYKVDVWANPMRDGQVFDGVTYRDHKQINLANRFDIFISWRDLSIIKQSDIRANKVFLWLQDIMFAPDYTPDLLDKIDKIIVLSKYHRHTATHVPEDKFFYTTNGINVELIEEVEKEMRDVKRTKNYCIYASSADRGLEPLAKMWISIKKRVPAIVAKWFYGWNSFEVFAVQEEHKKWQQDINELMVKAGIEYGGRIGKSELYKEYFKADYLTYPLIGPAETSCFLPNAIVSTDSGDKYINQLNLDDKVFTHANRLKGLNNLQKRNYKGNIITLTMQSGDKLTATDNHPILVTTSAHREDLNMAETIERGLAFQPIGTLKDSQLVARPRWTKDPKVKFYGEDENYLYERIKSIEVSNYEGDVYNMEVQDDNSYVVNGYVVHNCITVMEAQACGAIPITTGITALQETQQFGIKANLDDYQQILIRAMKAPQGAKSDEYRQKMMKWARETFNWDKVAASWVDELFYGKLPNTQK